MSGAATVHLLVDYPRTFYIDDSPRFGTAVEVDPETLARWQRVSQEYEAVQGEMALAVREVGGDE